MKKQMLTFLGLVFLGNTAITQQWTLLNTGTSATFGSIFSTDNDTCYALTGGLYKTSDAGQSWQSVNALLAYNFYFTDNNTGFAVRNEFIMRTTDGGITWQNVYSILDLEFLDVHFPSSSVGYAVAIDITL